MLTTKSLRPPILIFSKEWKPRDPFIYGHSSIRHPELVSCEYVDSGEIYETFYVDQTGCQFIVHNYIILDKSFKESILSKLGIGCHGYKIEKEYLLVKNLDIEQLRHECHERTLKYLFMFDNFSQAEIGPDNYDTLTELHAEQDFDYLFDSLRQAKTIAEIIMTFC